MIFRFANVKVEFFQTSNELRSPTVNCEETKVDWMNLFKEAADEQDPEKLLVLTREICRLLDEKAKKLKSSAS